MKTILTYSSYANLDVFTSFLVTETYLASELLFCIKYTPLTTSLFNNDNKLVLLSLDPDL